MNVLKFLGRRWSRFAEHDDGEVRLVLLNPFVVVFLVAASLIWAGPITHTGAHAKDVARATVNAITGQGEDTPGSSDTSYRLFAKDETTPRERLNSFVAQTMEYRREKIPRARPAHQEADPRRPPARDRTRRARPRRRPSARPSTASGSHRAT